MHQSELALFASDFDRALEPLTGELGATAARLSAARTELPFDAPALGSRLAALRSELGALLERVAGERCAVFVHGPAKAGKSTLLDALAGSRVSEVSILPGYPCLVRIAYGDGETAALVRFDGTNDLLADPTALRLLLSRGHAELARAVREARGRGEAFDPARHLRTAMRRVERTLPCTVLERASMELVECPPIHGPLFPSYAEMLMGEPDQARAAVFVVRASQLADDAVFDGVEELLGAFERMLLVVNLDERGRELSAAGELAPSVEREDPARLVAAFEELSTCEPLVRAVRSGRVPVLALDLLDAARARLHGAEESPSARRTRFADLERELFAVLDGHEATRALVTSALRRAREAGDELREELATPGLSDLPRLRGAAEEERAALARAEQAIGRLQARPRGLWEGEELFDGLRVRLEARGAERARARADDLAPALARAVEDWFSDKTSLEELVKQRLAHRVEAARAELVRDLARGLREELEPARAAARLGAGQVSDLGLAGMDVPSLLSAALARTRAELGPTDLSPIDVTAIPVRAKLGQKLVWRSAEAVRNALLGPPDAPARPLSSAEKAKRLGAEGRAALVASAEERARTILVEDGRVLAERLASALLSEFLEELGAALGRERERLDRPVRELEVRLEELALLGGALDALDRAGARAGEALAEATERFERTGVVVPVARAASPETDEPEMPAEERIAAVAPAVSPAAAPADPGLPYGAIGP